MDAIDAFYENDELCGPLRVPYAVTVFPGGTVVEDIASYRERFCREHSLPEPEVKQCFEKVLYWGQTDSR